MENALEKTIKAGLVIIFAIRRSRWTTNKTSTLIPVDDGEMQLFLQRGHSPCRIPITAELLFFTKSWGLDVRILIFTAVRMKEWRGKS